MRKRFLFVLTTLACMSGMSGWAQNEGKLTFGVISDIHFGNKVAEGPMVKVPQALKNISSYGSLDALAVVGDLTENGNPDQYEQLVSVLGNAETFQNPVGEFIFMMGNHDNYNGEGKANYQNGLASFNNGEAYPFHSYRVIKGYPFISVSVFSGNNSDTSNAANGTASYPAETVAWLEQAMDQASKECPGKPIFVFTHVPPRWTCYSTWAEWENGTSWGMKVLNPVLNKYPQAVVFSGHSHYPVGDPRSIHQGANPNSDRQNYYTVINTGSTTYSEIHPGAVNVGIHPAKFDYVTEGLIVTELEDGNIEIRRYDTYRNEEICAEQRWVLKAPFDGSMFEYADIRSKDDNPLNKSLYDGLPAPEFAEGAEVEAEPSAYDVKVLIPQAKDNDCVFRYDIRIKKDGSEMLAANLSVFSQFYLNSEMPEVLECVVDGLDAETDYVMEVVAYDSYENASEVQEVSFSTVVDDDPANDLPDYYELWTFEDESALLSSENTNAVFEPITINRKEVTVVEDAAAANIVSVAGPTEDNKAIFVPKLSGLKTLIFQEDSLKNYTLQMDVKVKDAGPYNGLLQADLTNNGDADCFIYKNTLGVHNLGYHGTINDNTWYRILFVNRDGEMNVYLDGKKISSAIDPRWNISGEGFFLLTDESNEMTDTELAEVAFWTVPLTDGQIRRLGKINTDEYADVLTPSVRLIDKNEFAISIRSNVSLTFDLPEWIEAVDVAPQFGLKDYQFRTKPMAEPGKRTGVITIESENLPAQEVQVTQITLGNEIPEATGAWTFDDPNDLLAGTGTATIYPAVKNVEGVFQIVETLSDAAIDPIPEGPTEGNGAICIPKFSYLWMKPNMEVEKLPDYTMMFDVRPETLDGYNALYKNNLLLNVDGSLFIKNAQVGVNTSGLGYNGALTQNKWHRIVVVIRDNYASVYIDGEKVGQSTGTREDIWALTQDVLFFGDNDGEEVLNDVAEVRYWDVPLQDAHIAQLGGVTQGEVEKEPVIDPISVWTFDDAENLLAGSGIAELQCAVKGEDGTPKTTDDYAAAGLVTIAGPTSENAALTVPVDTYLRMIHNDDRGVLESYSILMDIRPKKVSGFQALFQTKVNNEDDGAMFLKDNQIGINSAGLGYHNGIEAQKWYRVVMAVDNGYMNLYLDGRKLAGSKSADWNKWRMLESVLFFADNDGEEGVIDIAELRYWNESLTSSMVEQLGAVEVDGSGIGSIPAIKGENTVYDLSGRKISAVKLQKGIYIINGRKIVVR